MIILNLNFDDLVVEMNEATSTNRRTNYDEFYDQNFVRTVFRLRGPKTTSRQDDLLVSRVKTTNMLGNMYLTPT